MLCPSDTRTVADSVYADCGSYCINTVYSGLTGYGTNWHVNVNTIKNPRLVVLFDGTTYVHSVAFWWDDSAFGPNFIFAYRHSNGNVVNCGYLDGSVNGRRKGSLTKEEFDN